MNTDGSSIVSSHTLSDEELKKFVMQLAPEDRSILIERLAKCSREKFFTQSLPIAIIATGALYLGREPLVKALNIRPLRLPTYIFTAVTTLAVANFQALRGECKKRSLAGIDTLLEKYKYTPTGGLGRDDSKLLNREIIGGIPDQESRNFSVSRQSSAPSEAHSYEELRRRNRGLSGRASLSYPQKQSQDYEVHENSLENVMSQPPVSQRQEENWAQEPALVYSGQNEIPPRRGFGRNISYKEEEPPLMSGTPVGKSKSSYGDEGFS